MNNDINREINIEQVEFGINIDNVEYESLCGHCYFKFKNQ